MYIYNQSQVFDQCIFMYQRTFLSHFFSIFIGDKFCQMFFLLISYIGHVFIHINDKYVPIVFFYNSYQKDIFVPFFSHV